MCLYVENESTLLDDGVRRARKSHKCDECYRQIEPGESYRYWTQIDEYGDPPRTLKMCAHCEATVDLGAALTGCPKAWWWEMIHDLGDEGGFVGNILDDPGHGLSGADRLRMLRRVAQYRRRWRRPNGELYPLPEIPAVAA